MKILFICTGNTCRSVLACYYAAKLAADRSACARAQTGESLLAGSPAAPPPASGPVLEFCSAGLAVEKDVIQPSIISELLDKEGVKKFTHTPAALTAEMAVEADLILAMTAAHKTSVIGLFPKTAAKTMTLAQYAGFGAEDIADPYGRDDLFYFEIFKLIKTYVKAALERLKKEVQ